MAGGGLAVDRMDAPPMPGQAGPGGMPEDESDESSQSEPTPTLKSPDRVRTEFPESWLWTETVIGY